MTKIDRGEKAFRKAQKAARLFAPKSKTTFTAKETPRPEMPKQKFGPHTTVHSAALKRALDVIIGLPSVHRIIIGPSKGTTHSRPVGSIKLQGTVPNGVKMVGYSDRGITSFFIVTSNPEAAQQEIAKKFRL